MSKFRVLVCLVVGLGMLGCGGSAACPDGYARMGDLCMQVTGDAGPRGDAGATLGDGATADAGVTTEDVGAPGDAAMRGDAAAATPDAGMPCVPHAETCNERDDDCDGRVDEESTMVTFYADGDHDGHGAGVARLACVAPAMTAASADDCDDTDASRHPGATETCDGVDSNCDGSIDTELMRAYFVDADADGFGVDGTSVSACSPSGTHSATTAGDCDDSCATCHLGGIEVCDGRDQDCMLGADNGVQLVFYRDADSDTFGDASTTATACAAPVGYVTTATDCLDSNATVHPGAAEVCNAIDDNCVGGADEGLTFLTYYVDLDGDGYAPSTAGSVRACAALARTTTRLPSGAGQDCFDTDPRAFPGQTRYFSTPIVGTTTVLTRFDFDCNGASLTEHGGGATCTGPSLSCSSPVVLPAFTGTAPACGAPGTLMNTCGVHTDGRVPPTLVCGPTSVPSTLQGCR